MLEAAIEHVSFEWGRRICDMSADVDAAARA